jgi:hypothetical protein
VVLYLALQAIDKKRKSAFVDCSETKKKNNKEKRKDKREEKARVAAKLKVSAKGKEKVVSDSEESA